jgi:uncharacterized protein YaeQ
MALKSTIFKVELQISDLDRAYFRTHTLTLARHPSETDERMMVRLLAFALSADDALEFGRGLSTDDEPDLWRRGLTGEIIDWIEVGLPDERRLRRACGRAEQVSVLTYGGRIARSWWEQNQAQLLKQEKLAIIDLPAEATRELATRVARTMEVNCTVQEGELWLDVDGAMLHVVPEIRQGRRPGLPGR